MRPAPRFIAAALALTGAVSGCDKPVAIGEADHIVVATPDSVWTALRSDIEQAFEPRIFTVRDERIFEVFPVDPRSGDWGDLRNLRRVLVIGQPGDPWVEETLEEVDGPAPSPPAVLTARNVWAQNQEVTLVLLAPGTSPEAATPLIREAGESMLRRYEASSRGRMFVTGVDTAMADSIRRAFGASLLAPRVYRVAQAEPNLLVYRNDNPDPSQLIREVDIAWRPAEEVDLTPEAALEWRSELAARVTQPSQVTEPEIAESRRLSHNGNPAVEIHGVWSNPPGEWPAAGPFIARLVQCGDRVYLLNAWLYAPGRAKYPYMIQLATLLERFRC